jgi:hypothetical protein
MDKIGIEITLGIEDSYILELDFKAFNGIYLGQVKWYCYPKDLEEIGKGLMSFPSKIPDEFYYNHSLHNYYHLTMRAYTFDKLGHCALEICMKKMEELPAQAECRFSIVVDEPWAIHRLGMMLEKFSTKKYRSLKWSTKSEEDDLLVEN